MNAKSLKTLSKLLVLLIFMVSLFIVSLILYCIRYLPDLYNYMNANITIKVIPKVHELNLTVFEVDFDENKTTTETYDISTTEDYVFNDKYDNEAILDDDFDEFLAVESRKKRDDDNYLVKSPVAVDYFFDYRLEDDKDTLKTSLISESKVLDILVTDKYIRNHPLFAFGKVSND